MKKLLMIAALPFTLSMAYNAQAATTYIIDPNHNNITWHANHFGFSNPSGKFAKSEGSITLDEANPEKSTVELTIDTTSINTGIEKFDEHLKSKDFFNVSEFPKATFKSTKVEKTGEKTAKVTGDLTLNGVTKPVVLDVTFNKKGEHPMNKKETVGFSAKAIIKRSEWNINYSIPAVSDDVQLSFETEASVK